MRQDLTGGVPTVARVALADRLAALLPAAADARAFERALGRLVEEIDDGRDEAPRASGGGSSMATGGPIGLTAEDLATAAKRRGENGRRRSR